MEKVKQYFKQQKLNYKMVAEVCGTTEHVVKKWFSGGTKPRLEAVVKLVFLSLGELTVFDFFTEEELNNLFKNKDINLNSDFKRLEAI